MSGNGNSPSSSDLLSRLIDGLLGTFEQLAAAAEDPWLLDRLLQALDANDQRLNNGLVEGLRNIGQGVAQIRALQASSDVSLQTIGSALDALRNVVAGVRAVSQGAASAYPELGADLVNLVVLGRLRSASTLAYQIAVMLGLVEYQRLRPITIGDEVVRVPQPVERLVFDRIGTLFTDPLALIREQLPPAPLATVANAQQTADTLVNRVGGVLDALGLPWAYSYPPEHGKFLGDAAPAAAHTLVMYVPSAMVGDGTTAGVCISLSSADADDLGVVLTPFGTLTLQGTLGGWSVSLETAADVQALAFGGGKGVKVLASAATTAVHAVGKVALPATAPGTPAFVIGSTDGTRLELGAPQLSATLDAAQTGIELGLSAETGKSALVIDPGDGDGFISSILPSDGMRAEFDLGLAWSNKTGLSLRGGAGLDVTLPINRSIAGIITLSSAHLSLLAQDGRLAAETSLTGSLAIGPVKAVVDRIGLSTILTFPPSGGNLGVADLDFGFKPPTGIGLSVEAQGVVTGGGFLFHDPAQQLYAGSLQLLVGNRFGLDVVGLLTTRMPDGSDGYSLLLAGLAQFPPIPLGFGFALNKLGALIGINRTIDVDALGGTLAAGDLDAVLFPGKPTALASMPDALGKLFPPRQDVHTVGILAGIAWGGAALAQIDLGLFFDSSAPTRVVAIGRLSIERPQITLHVLALGVLDFALGELDLQAHIVNSRIAGGDVSGDAAMMQRWRDDPAFVLSLGGFHPAFRPPTEFTRRFRPLQRISIRAHTDESVLRLGMQAYLAVTSNTVQMGARVDFGVSVSAFSVDGMVSFDALIQFDPALFIDVTVQGIVAVKAGGITLLGASISAELVGPGDWFAHGTATISVLWWDLDFHFTIGSDPGRPPLPTVDGVALVAAALADPRNWGSQLTTGDAGLVAMRRPAAPGSELVLHPLDELIVRQQVVPLGLVADRLEAGRLAAARTFEVAVKVGGAMRGSEPVLDQFARSKYVVMSDADRLAAPSFEPMPSGVRVTLDPNAAPAPSVAASWTYDEFVWTPRGLQAPSPRAFAPDAVAISQALATSATAEAPLRRAGPARYRLRTDRIAA